MVALPVGFDHRTCNFLLNYNNEVELNNEYNCTVVLLAHFMFSNDYIEYLRNP